MEYNKEWEYGTPVDCDCENNFIHVDCGCKSKEVCECENILLEISKLKTEDTVLQREIDEISGASISGVTEEEVDAKIASAKSELLQYITSLQEQINSLTSSISGCCSQTGETQYRWITMTGEDDYWCSGTTKMSKEKEQSSNDGLTWTDTGNIRNGETALQTDCEQCGYIPQNTKVMFILNNGNVQYKECDEYPEVRNMDVHYLIDFNNIKTAYISECANAIGGMAFTSISGLTYVSIPNTITSIGGSAFFGCSSLDNVVIPSGVTSIGMHAFSGCTSLTSINIPDGVETFSGYVFADCTALEDVTIGTGCTNIENRMFENCTNLQSVTVKAITPPAMQDAFYHTNDSFIIYVPAQSLNAYKTAPGWNGYANRLFAIV